MPDPYAKVQQGDPVEFNAASWNSMLDAAKLSKGKFETRAPLITSTLSSTIIQVLNSTGHALPRNSVLGLGDPIFTPDDTSLDAFMREITFRAYTPDVTKHNRKYVVLLDPAPANRVVRAYIAGVCHVKIDQRDEAHEYANIVDTVEDHLRSSRHGHARILWREGLQGSGYGYYDVGIQWGIVMLGVTGSSGAIGKAIDDITGFAEGAYYGGFGSGTYGIGFVDLYRSANGNVDGPMETIRVFNPGKKISAGKWVAVEWDADDDAYVGPLECETVEPYA